MSSYQVIIDGTPVEEEFYDALSSLEVEENADLPDAVKLVLPVAAADHDLTWVADDRLRPFSNVAVVVTPDEGPAQCIFDGYVLSHSTHLESGITASTLEVWGQDASVLMGLEEKVREWSGLTDGAVANQVFSQYGFTPDAGNTADDSPAHTEDAHTLMQRASDIEFLRRLARRTGRWCRVRCDESAGQRIGYFAVPDVSAEPVVTLELNDPETRQLQALDFRWDVSRPNKVAARQASLTDADEGGVSADTADGGLAPLDARDLRAFAGRDTTVVLTAAGDDSELPHRARAVLRDASWFSRCEGTADISMVKHVLRVGSVVAVASVGTLLSGNYVVTRVRHTITTNAHAMAFTLSRNAVGPSAEGGGGGLLGGIL